MSGSASRDYDEALRTPKANLRQEKIQITRVCLKPASEGKSLTTINEETSDAASTYRHQLSTVSDWFSD